jgi:predicted transcriptional regulator
LVGLRAVRDEELFGHSGYGCQCFVRGAGQLGLDFRESAAFGLAALERDELQQVAGAIEGGAAAHAQGAVYQTCRGVPPDGAPIRQVSDPSVGRTGVLGGQCHANPLHQLIHRPHADNSDTVIVTLSNKNWVGESTGSREDGPMSVNSQASAMLNALASPTRLALLSVVSQRQGAGADCSFGAIAEALDMPIKALLKEVARLEDCGLLIIVNRTLSANLPALKGAAAALVDELPIARLLTTAPDLERYFVNGRLTDLAVDHSVKLRLAPLLARLLPDDRALTEAEVNELLNQVHDDHAFLRRMLVDFGQLARDGSANYRRAG